MIELDDSFFLAEKRDDFWVSTERKRIWAVQLDLLKKLIDVCDENGIKCFVIWGTLLGTVRHKGFIPWDDDVDVALLREDYDKLCSLPNSSFSYPYFFQNAYTDKKYFMSYSRLRRSDTTGIITGNESIEYNNGIFIDIYPLDAVPKNRAIYTWKRFFCNLYAGMARSKALYQNGNLSLKRKILYFLSLRMSYEECCIRHEKWCKKYNDRIDEVGLFYHSGLVKKYHFNRHWADKIVKLRFEMMDVPAPYDYEHILQSVYGDYMSFPPIEERGKWHDGQITYDPNVSYKEYLSRDV